MVAPNRPLRGGVGSNLILTSLLALLSYVPFEWVAKGTLLLCVLLFIVDPFPPLSRLVSLLATIVVAGLSKSYNNYQRHEQHNQDVEEENEERVGTDDEKRVAEHRGLDPAVKDKTT